MKKVIALTLIVAFSLTSIFANNINDDKVNSKRYKFVLTHMLGKKLDNNAYFYVGDFKVWELDFRNGDVINYTIVSMDSNNTMCGITAKDSYGDFCEICITKKYGDTTEVEFKYNGKKIIYTGYLQR